MLITLGMKPANVPKLIPNLRNKEKYILHYRNRFEAHQNT